MLRKCLLIFSCFYVVASAAQVSSTDDEFEAVPVNGKEQVEQVLQTQLTLPKMVVAGDFETDITLFFDIDSTGTAFNFKREKNVSYKVIQNEVERVLGYLKFKRTLHVADERPYFLAFHLSKEKYNKYYKQKIKFIPKKTFPPDSTFTVYSKADKSPEYYKNGDDGLKDFILSEMEYPKVAIERSIEGTAVIEFIVETNGYITNIVTKKGVNAGCTEEAIRILKQTRWQPAVLNNKLVRYSMTYPITFSLRNTLRDFGTSSSTTGQ